MSEIIGYPLGWIMYFIYNFIPNYGICIILFTLLTKLILLPTGYKQQLSTVRMQAMNPKLAQLKKQYANNPQKMQEEQQKLYAQEGVNPMASCLPMIVSIIILYGILDVVYRPLTHILRFKENVIDEAIKVTGANPKSRPELTILKAVKENPGLFKDEIFIEEKFVERVSEFKNTFLGVDLGAVPTINPDGGWTKAAVALVLIPIISGLVQIIFTIYSQRRQKKMNPDMNMGAMNIMLYIMPAFSVWLAFTVPAGVGFYWIWSSVFSLVQSIALNNYLKPARVDKITAKQKEKNKNKPGLMQKLMDQQAELLAMQEEAKKNGRHDYSAETENMSKSEKQSYNRQLINEARKRMAEKYGEEYKEND